MRKPKATIASLDVISLEYAVPRELAYGTARGLNFKRSSSIIKLTTDTGVVGHGELAGPVAPIREYMSILRPFFVGRSLCDYELLGTYVRNRFYHFGEGHFGACLGGINVAALDALGRTLDLPVHDLLGGRALDRIPCYATTGYITADGMAGLERQLGSIDKSQFSGAKIKIGLNPKSDVERVRLARRMLGDDMLLMVDVNGNYTVDVALQSTRAIEPYNIHWYEEPLPMTDVRGHAELRARSPIPIATGEGLHGAHAFKPLVDARGIDILQPAMGRCGGLSEAKVIAALADLSHLRMVPAVWGGAFIVASAIQFIASLPSTPHTENMPFPRMLEFDTADNPLRDQVLKTPLKIEAGSIAVPDGPGLGIELDPEAIERFRVKS